MTQERVSVRELYTGGLESLLSLELQHEGLIPTMVSLAECSRLRSFFEDLPPMIRRQRRRLELLLRSVPDVSDGPAPTRNGLQEQLLDLRLMQDPEDRDAELVKASDWIAGLQIDQYVATRDWAMQLGDFESARHLQRSLNAVGASRLRLLRISQRIRHLASQAPTIDVGDFGPSLTQAAVALP